MEALSKKRISIIIMIAVFVATVIIGFSGISLSDTRAAASGVQNNDIYYCDDLNYNGEGDSYVSTEIINYATKTVTSYSINGSFPSYYNTNSQLVNACANVAGANIIGYYDRYFADLIPNHTPGFMRQTNYIYYAMSVNLSIKQGVIDTLYTLMSTNNPNPGTSQTQYRNGLTTYASNTASKSVTYNTVMSNSAFSISLALTQMQAGNPISLFLSGYNVTTISDTGSTATLSKVIYSGNHIMIVYGYQTINYYNSLGSLIATKTYLRIASGLEASTKLYVLNNNGTLNDAEAAHIY